MLTELNLSAFKTRITFYERPDFKRGHLFGKKTSRNSSRDESGILFLLQKRKRYNGQRDRPFEKTKIYLLLNLRNFAQVCLVF